MQALSYRPAASDDAAVLMEMIQEFHVFEHLPWNEQVVGAVMRLLADRDLGRVILAFSGVEPAGYVAVTFGYSFEFHGRDALVDELYLREPFRGAGLGSMLLRHAEDACRAEGIAAVHLEVDRSNDRAQRTYRRAGYADHDRYLMTRWL